MSRAHLLLDDHIFEQKMYEALNIEDIKSSLSSIAQKAQSVNSELKKGLEESKTKYQQELQKIVQETPELKNVIDKDLDTAKSKIEAIASKIKSKFSKLKIKQKVTEEMLVEEFRSAFSEVCLNESIATLSAIRGLKLSKGKGFIHRVLAVRIGFIGTILLSILHVTLLGVLVKLGLPAGIAMAIVAIFVAPISEEWFKKATVQRYGMKTPAFVFATIEFIDYISKFLNIPGSTVGMMGALNLIITLVGRLYAAEMHMATTKLYKDDYDKYGKVQKSTVMKGRGIHFLWNLSTVLVSILGVIAGFGTSMGVGIVGLAVPIAITSLIQKYVKRSEELDNKRIEQKIGIPADAIPSAV